MTEGKKIKLSQELIDLVEAARDLKYQWMKEPLDTHEGQNAALQVIRAYDRYENS